jgi:hypothetical protein
LICNHSAAQAFYHNAINIILITYDRVHGVLSIGLSTLPTRGSSTVSADFVAQVGSEQQATDVQN